MKLKFKLGKVQIAALVIAGLVILALLLSRSGNGGSSGDNTLDNAAVKACDDFAAGSAAARSQTARLGLADKVTASATRSDNDAVRDRAMELGRNADETNAVWRTSATAFSQACTDAGWSAP